MADYGFPDQPLPIDEVKRPDGSYFFERSKLESGQFKSAFQKQHVQPEADMSGRGADFVRRISSTDVESRYRFSGSDFSLNGTPLPVSDADAVRLGSSAHRGSHQAYTDVVELYRQAETFRAQQVETAKLNELLGQPNPPAEAAARIEARKFADNFMAMEWKGIENTLRLASQVDGIPELGNAHRPGLVMHSGDPFRMASGFPDAASYNADFFNQMSIDRIAGELSTAPGHIGETTAGIEAFQAGVENRVLPYDRERVLLMEAADFSDAASKQKFFETRADIIASDQLMRANVGDPVKVAQLELTPEYRQFRDSILRVISDPTILRPGSKTPTDYIEVEKLIEKFPVGKAGASFDQAQAEARRLQSDILYKMQAADPAGIERLRAKDQKIDDFFKNERGEVNTKVALTAGMIAAGAIYLQTLYDAQTVDTGESWNYGDSALNSLRNRAIGRCAGVLEAPRPILRTCRLPDRGPNSALGDPKPRRAGRHKQTQNVTDGQIAQRSARPL